MKISNGGYGAGCAFWILLVPGVVLCVLLMAIEPVLEPVLSAGADSAAARRAEAAAEKAEAEAAKVAAEAQAEALLMLTEEGVKAIQADRSAAHPLLWLADALVDVGLYAFAVFCAGLLGLGLIYAMRPDDARRLVEWALYRK